MTTPPTVNASGGDAAALEAAITLDPAMTEAKEKEQEFKEDENEEVDFDNPKFKKTDIWNDYAEDLDFEE